MSDLQKAMVAIAAELATKGIGKDRRNSQQGYNFRGIDDMLNVVGPVMARHGVTLSPYYQIIHHNAVTRQTKSGPTEWFHVLLRGVFSFRLGEELLVTETIGEALDNADKATNKAMSNAFKYALITTFAIPVVGADDADLHSPGVAEPVQKVDVEAWRAKIGQAEDRTALTSLWNKFTATESGTGDADGYALVRNLFSEAGKKWT